jgi:hypothetical protein
LKIALEKSDIPEMPEGLVPGGNEVEGILVRALRVRLLAPEPPPPLRDILSGVLQEIRPSAHRFKMDYMDLIAVKECTDSRFLPKRFREIAPVELERRIEELRRFV